MPREALGLHPRQFFQPAVQLQLDRWFAAGVRKRDVFADVTSGIKTAIERPGMKRLLENAGEGDNVVVWRVDRLGRSLINVLNAVAVLRSRGMQFGPSQTASTRQPRPAG